MELLLLIKSKKTCFCSYGERREEDGPAGGKDG